MRATLADSPSPEGPYVLPALASTLAGLTPFELRRLVFSERGISAVRTRHVRGRLLIRLSDLRPLARTLFDGRTTS